MQDQDCKDCRDCNNDGKIDFWVKKLEDGFTEYKSDTDYDGTADIIIYRNGRWMISFSDFNHDGIMDSWDVAYDKIPIISYQHNFSIFNNALISVFYKDENGKPTKWLTVNKEITEQLELWDDNEDMFPDRWELSKCK